MELIIDITIYKDEDDVKKLSIDFCFIFFILFCFIIDTYFRKITRSSLLISSSLSGCCSQKLRNN
jgi:hypothetical protein